jgi:guanylate kinase
MAYDQLRAVYLAEKTRPAYQHAWRREIDRQWGRP